MIEDAARRFGQTTRDYRNLIDRAGGKIFSAILRNLVPPPLLSNEQRYQPTQRRAPFLLFDPIANECKGWSKQLSSISSGE